ncbi:MAG: transketolase, partial [Candidatus Paceibacterota bacterium]
EKLGNLIAIVDRNNIQIDGFTEDVMPLESLYEKWSAFNWHVFEINGHNFEEIISILEEAKTIQNRPVVIIAHTVPGKGVKEFENKPYWHGNPPSKEQADMALKELRTLGGQITGE